MVLDNLAKQAIALLIVRSTKISSSLLVRFLLYTAVSSRKFSWAHRNMDQVRNDWERGLTVEGHVTAGRSATRWSAGWIRLMIRQRRSIGNDTTWESIRYAWGKRTNEIRLVGCGAYIFDGSSKCGIHLYLDTNSRISQHVIYGWPVHGWGSASLKKKTLKVRQPSAITQPQAKVTACPAWKQHERIEIVMLSPYLANHTVNIGWANRHNIWFECPASLTSPQDDCLQLSRTWP